MDTKFSSGGFTLSHQVRSVGCILAALWSYSPVLAAGLVDDYLSAKNSFIKQYAQHDVATDSAMDQEDQQALKSLEPLLKKIISKPFSGDFSKSVGVISLSTLHQTEAIEDLDGLKYTAGERWVIASTVDLAKHALKDWSAPRQCDDIAISQIFTKTIMIDAAITRVAPLPISKPADFNLACAALAVESQDSGPYMPTLVTYYAQRGDYVFVTSHPIKVPTKAPSKCLALWKKHEAEYQKILGKRDKSVDKDGKLLSDIKTFDEKGTTTFNECVSNELQNTKDLKDLTAQAQRDIERLR